MITISYTDKGYFHLDVSKVSLTHYNKITSLFNSLDNTMSKGGNNLIGYAQLGIFIEQSSSIGEDSVFASAKDLYSYTVFSGYINNLLDIKNSPVDKIVDGYNELIPEGIVHRLLPFQSIGSHFLCVGRKVLLADVVGLGKTIQSIMACRKILLEKKVFNCLIVCPSSLRKKWSNDIKKFLGEEHPITIIDGNKKDRAEQYKTTVSENSFTIMSYDIAYRDWYELLFPLIMDDDLKRVIVFDEAQYLKNGESKRSQLCRILSTKATYCWGLSATFIEINLMDIFCSLMVINPNVFGSRYDKFMKNHVVVDFFGNVEGYKNLSHVKKTLDPFKLRRQKEQVVDQLPNRFETIHWCSLTKDQSECYGDVLANVSDSIVDELKKEKISQAIIFAQLQYLIQCCLSTELLDYDKPSSAKLELLKQIVAEQFDKEKLVIFCFYKKMLEIIKRELVKQGIPENKIVVAHGDNASSMKVRNNILDDFNSPNGKTQILLASHIFKEGVDLIGAAAMIHYDLVWNPAVIEQRSGRIDRIGQKAENVNIIFMVTEGTIEQEMWNRLYDRKKLSGDLLDDGYINKRITVKEVLNILGIQEPKR